jgi:hypothetical protein
MCSEADAVALLSQGLSNQTSARTGVTTLESDQTGQGWAQSSGHTSERPAGCPPTARAFLCALADICLASSGGSLTPRSAGRFTIGALGAIGPFRMMAEKGLPRIPPLSGRRLMNDCACTDCLCYRSTRTTNALCAGCRGGNHPGDPRPPGRVLRTFRRTQTLRSDSPPV